MKYEGGAMKGTEPWLFAWLTKGSSLNTDPWGMGTWPYVSNDPTGSWSLKREMRFGFGTWVCIFMSGFIKKQQGYLEWPQCS